MSTHSGTHSLATYPEQNAALATGDVRTLLDGTSTSNRENVLSTLCGGNDLDELTSSQSDTFPFYIDVTNAAINGLSKMSWQNGGRSGVRQFSSTFLADSTLFLTVLVDPEGDKAEFYDIIIIKECATTSDPTKGPTEAPSHLPTRSPSKLPTAVPSKSPTRRPTVQPTLGPSDVPSAGLYRPSAFL